MIKVCKYILNIRSTKLNNCKFIVSSIIKKLFKVHIHFQTTTKILSFFINSIEFIKLSFIYYTYLTVLYFLLGWGIIYKRPLHLIILLRYIISLTMHCNMLFDFFQSSEFTFHLKVFNQHLTSSNCLF